MSLTVRAHLIIVLLSIPLLSCIGDSPTNPTRFPSNPRLSSISIIPEGAGVQYGTEFIFTTTGSFPEGTTYKWHFGDGASATGQRVSHVYQQEGTFNSEVIVSSNGKDSSSYGRQVVVRSLVGEWEGSITGHTGNYVRYDPVTRFVLHVGSIPYPGESSFVPLHDATWRDDAGCRIPPSPSNGYIHQEFGLPRSGVGSDRSEVAVGFGIESFRCNDYTDFYLRGVADATFDVVEGVCSNSGPDCRFRMQRSF